MCVFIFFFTLTNLSFLLTLKAKRIRTSFLKILIWLQQVLVAGHVRYSSPTRDGNRTPALGAWSLSHWTIRDVPIRTHCMQCYTTSTQYSSSIQKEFSGSDSKESTCNRGDSGLIPELGRSPGEGNGNPLQYSCLEKPMDRGDWWPTYSPCSHKESEMTK